MKKVAVAVAAVAAVLAMALLSGVALAGDHHGDHGHQNHGQTSGSAGNQSSSSDQQPGQKPNNTTDHNTSCTSGGGSGSSATCHSDKSSKSDASKRYGNGKTAAQIANGKGAPSGTTIYGPGNSQPHKICGRDVHAYKGGDCSKQKEQQQPQPKPTQQTVTFCDMSSPTTGDLQTKNAGDVARHEFDGNPEETRDIVPPFTLDGKTYSENWDSNGQAIFNAHCNLSSGVQSTTTTKTENEHGTGKVYVCHATGSATNPYVLIHISINGWIHGHSRHQDGRDIFLGDKPGPCPTGSRVQGTTTTVATTTTTPVTTTSTVAATTTVATTTTQATTVGTTTTVAAAAASTPPSNTSGVKGASKTLTAPSHRSSGVLGAAKTLGRTATSGTLPFTGLRLWIVELIALGLIGAGVATRLIARRGTSS